MIGEKNTLIVIIKTTRTNNHLVAKNTTATDDDNNKVFLIKKVVDHDGHSIICNFLFLKKISKQRMFGTTTKKYTFSVNTTGYKHFPMNVKTTTNRID